MKKTKRIKAIASLLAFVFLLLAPTVSLNAGESITREQTKVYVVMSNTAHAYHLNKYCKGLKNATHPIKQVTLEEAQKMGRRPCKLCCGH